MEPTSPVAALLQALSERGVDLASWGLAWARVLPTVVIVPAFGGRLLPAPARAVLGLAMAVTLIPAVAQSADSPGTALGLRFVLELLRGLPLALSTAAILWAAMMAGGVADDVSGGQRSASVLPDAPTPIGTLLGLYAAFAFLQLGGAARVVEALSEPLLTDGPVLLRVAFDLVAAVEVALSLAAPLLAAVIVWEVTAALITRAASPAYTQQALAPFRALVVLGVLAVSLEGMLGLLTELLQRPL